MAKYTSVPDQYAPSWLETLDGRTAVAQEMRRRFAEVASDLGGHEGLSYLKRSLLSRYLWAEYWIQTQERAIADGDEIDMGKYTQAVNSAVGLANKLGLDRVARDAPNLADYLAAKERSQ